MTAVDEQTWQEQPLTAEEKSLWAIEYWPPAEDWADWIDATRL